MFRVACSFLIEERTLKLILQLQFNAFLVPGTNYVPTGLHCIFGEHQSWETEQLLLNRLKEVEVTRMKGSEHEVTFVKQLFNWATSLEKMSLFFDELVTESVAN
jgi:hypothetical protein